MIAHDEHVHIHIGASCHYLQHSFVALGQRGKPCMVEQSANPVEKS